MTQRERQGLREKRSGEYKYYVVLRAHVLQLLDGILQSGLFLRIQYALQGQGMHLATAYLEVNTLDVAAQASHTCS